MTIPDKALADQYEQLRNEVIENMGRLEAKRILENNWAPEKLDGNLAGAKTAIIRMKRLLKSLRQFAQEPD